MKKHIFETWKIKRESNYLVPAILLVTHAIFLFKALFTYAIVLLFLIIISALRDLSVSKDKDNAISNWVLLGIEEGVILTIWSFYSLSMLNGILSLLGTIMLIVLFVKRLR